MEIITQGLIITTQCHYIKFTQSGEFQFDEDFELDCFTIKYPRDVESKYIVDKRIDVLESKLLHESDYIKINNPVINLNGLKLTKLTVGDYTYRQFLVNDINQYIIKYSEHSCTLLIPTKLAYDVDTYLHALSHCRYLKVLDSKELHNLRNYYSIRIVDKDQTIESNSEFEFNSKKYYQQYLMDKIDVQSSFINKFRALVRSYGLDLIRYPIDSNTKSVNHIVYKFTDIGKQETHKTAANPLRYAVAAKDSVEFELTCPDLVILNDFKTKYQNLDFISNFTEFYTFDKLDRQWISTIKWGEFPTDFNQDYETDNQGNIGFKATFNAEISYYIIYDQKYYECAEIVIDLCSQAVNGAKEINEQGIVK